jgi:hypothetical protein
MLIDGGEVNCPPVPVTALPSSTVVMRITPSEAERNARAFSNATLDKAAQCMRTDGVLALGDIVNPALIREARETFVQRYDRYLDGQEHEDALEVGDRRLMITVDLEPPFDRRELLRIHGFARF